MKLNQTSELQKNRFLTELIKILRLKKGEIILANKKDLKLAEKSDLPSSLIQRLEFTEMNLEQAVKRLNGLKKISSNVGKIIESKKLENGLMLNKTRTALGTIAIVYESRPEVTIDAVGLCIKSGNCVILKGGSESLNTNLLLIECVVEALENSLIDVSSVKFINTRRQFLEIIKSGKEVDLVIARGSYKLVKAVIDESSVPVLSHSAGGARIYIDKSADLEKAKKIIINAKTSKPAACNSLDTVLIHKDTDNVFVVGLIEELQALGVKVLRSQWEEEFLDLVLNIKTVENVEEAIRFIKQYGKGHSEGIIAEDKKIIQTFVNNIDCAAVFVNCSTRFHDGFEFGMGAEMGIATGKLHARGPVGLKELTAYRWEVYGNGQTR